GGQGGVGTVGGELGAAAVGEDVVVPGDVGAVEQQVVVAGGARDHIAAIAGVPHERIVAGTEEGHVVAATADDRVIAGATFNKVIAVAAVDRQLDPAGIQLGSVDCIVA